MSASGGGKEASFAEVAAAMLASRGKTAQPVASQPITPELREWIVEQAKAGHGPELVLKAMMDSGWQESVAIVALEETLEGFLRDHALTAGVLQATQVSKPMPDPDVHDGCTVAFAHDREFGVAMTLRHPQVVVLTGFLSDEECDHLRAVATPRLIRSETVDVQTGGSEVNEARTSSGMFFSRGEDEVIRRIEARIAALVKWPVENGEGMQVLHYTAGAEYKPHYDYFEPGLPGTPTILKRGGQRVGTVVMYLNTPEKGGGTSFPDVNLIVSAHKGNAVFFSYESAHPSTRSLHGGAPVVAGEKWVATKWMREGRFD